MTEDLCAALSDKMPEVAHGRADWSSDEAAHLERCAECRSEFALAQTAVALGRRADALVHPEAVARAVTGRLRQAARRPTLVRRLVWAGGAIAAAAALVIALRTVGAPSADDGSSVEETVLAIQVPGIDSLTVAELEWVLESIDEPIDASSTLGGPGLDELDDPELERLLRAWEG